MSWVVTAIVGTTVANIAYSEHKDKGLRKQNRKLSKTYDKQIEDLTSSIAGIEKYSEGLIDLESDSSRLRKKDMFGDFLTKSEDIGLAYESTMGKTDLAYSGTVEELSRREREKLSKQVRIGEADEALRTEKSLLEILTSKEDSLSGVRNEIFNLESAKAGLRT
tara:strand:- start:13 stop:504 length:492 start_codon:yes stop_codon:yes gene_type:complete